ncbi:phosphatidylinositol 3-kinase 2 [Musca vetustissima]|uniref:phosphatidylinositol 3-kinase 2 n=1 Tax=Musca vetustissima TaxID=27455 RepID=UPI002AB7C470|nr:phosphatidylinositol 3-kinase 2 [Musca vetustissima]
MSPGLSLLQAAAASSPPPHSYRHSRAYRHFKNPPQPHMCIRTTTEAGEELFINVLSWTRIVIPQEPSDPIPLYGGMRVPPGSPRSPPIVFAVMANPEVLKDSGRHSKDPEERRAMVELMCDFVEAMNPGVKLVRNAVILKDRDISGELKDVWNAVQAQRDREREEQMMQQRQQQQQQHYHNLTTNGGGGGVPSPGGSLNSGLSNNTTPITQQQHMFSKGGYAGGNFMGDGSSSTPPRSRKFLMQQELQRNEENYDATLNDVDVTKPINLAQLAEHLDNKIAATGVTGDSQLITAENHRDENNTSHDMLMVTASNGNTLKDATDSNSGAAGVTQKNELNNQLNANNLDSKTQIISNGAVNGIGGGGSATNANTTETTAPNSNTATESVNCTSITNNIAKNSHNSTTPPTTTTTPSTNTTTNNPAAQSTTTTTTAAQPAVANPVPPPTTKKEKLGGFLPNGCIFPRFTKNNKHKDKDKEGKTKDKEKNVLLSALKKSKDKKSQAAAAAAAAAASAAANHQDEKQQKELINTSATSPTTVTTANNTMAPSSGGGGATSQHPDSTNNHLNKNNCLQQLECEVQKLDLNHHIDKNASSSSSSSAATTTTPAPTSNNSHNNTGVGVH